MKHPKDLVPTPRATELQNFILSITVAFSRSTGQIKDWVLIEC